MGLALYELRIIHLTADKSMLLDWFSAALQTNGKCARSILIGFEINKLKGRYPLILGEESNATINHQPLPVMPIKIDVHTYFASSPKGKNHKSFSVGSYFNASARGSDSKIMFES